MCPPARMPASTSFSSSSLPTMTERTDSRTAWACPATSSSPIDGAACSFIVVLSCSGRPGPSDGLDPGEVVAELPLGGARGDRLGEQGVGAFTEQLAALVGVVVQR